MPTLEELHDAYMKSRDDFDNYNVDDDHEAQKINEYFLSEDDVVELVHWKPVARDIEYENHIAKLKMMKEFNER